MMETLFVRILPLLIFLVWLSTPTALWSHSPDAVKEKPPKPRLLVLTDMSSLESGVREPDDAQSMIRLMLYTNEFDVEGLIASSNMRHGQTVRPELIRQIVDAYEKVLPNLRLHRPDYPPADQLRRVIKSGQPVADQDIPVFESIGKGKDTEGSEWIIQSVDHPDERPLWITIWGGSADLAQALWKVRQTRSSEALAKFVSKIRVHAISDQDKTGPWIRAEFPDLFYIVRKVAMRGMYRGGDTTLVRSDWVQQNIKQDHGALGALYPDYRGGDIWVRELGRVRGIKEGDTPSYLGLIANGLNDIEKLTWENWGGRIRQDTSNPQHYYDAIDSIGSYQTDPAPELATVYRWRPAFQADFKARLDWCVQPYSQANHPPVYEGKDVVEKKVKAGEKVYLKAGAWKDPDGNTLSFRWQILPEESSVPDEVAIVNASSPSAYFEAPATAHPQTVDVLLTVADDGKPSLYGYRRYIFTIEPKKE